MKTVFLRLLTCLYSVILLLNFTACESDSDGGGEFGLIGRYWAQYEYQMEQLVNKVDNAEPFWKLWDEDNYGSANYASQGEMFYFVNKNTVHIIPYVGAKSLSDAKKWGCNELLFTLIYGNDVVYYYGDLNNPDICSYEILDGKLYIYSNSDFEQYNFVDDGFVYSGRSIPYKSIELRSEIVKENPKLKITEGQKVDLGLSVKWAGWNIGAKSPEEYGGYYAWGETVEKYNYSEDFYTCDYYALSKMNIGGTEYDVARAKWGNNWRMPSLEDFRELMNKCKWSLIRYKDVYGARIEGPNGNSIFMPIPGVKVGTKLEDEGLTSYYWIDSPRDLSISTGPLKVADIFTLELNSSYDNITGTTYYCSLVYNGGSVRAVSDN